MMCCSLRNMTWLGDTGYNHCGLYLHDVHYKKKNGDTIQGTFLPILFENLTDPIITGREEIAAPKWGCEIDISSAGDSYAVKMSWRGTTFVELNWSGLQDQGAQSGQKDNTAPVLAKPDDKGMLMYRYVPAVGEPGKADAEYPVFEEFTKPPQSGATKDGELEESKFSQAGASRTRVAKEATIKTTAGDWDCLPTIHHIAEGWAGVPIFEIIEATVVDVPHVGDVRNAKRIE